MSVLWNPLKVLAGKAEGMSPGQSLEQGLWYEAHCYIALWMLKVPGWTLSPVE